MRLLIAALMIVSAGTAQAQAKIQCNAHGAVLTNSIGEVFYLGKSCDAAKKGGGTGHWWYAASAFIVEIDGKGVRYPFEIECDVPYCYPPDLKK